MRASLNGQGRWLPRLAIRVVHWSGTAWSRGLCADVVNIPFVDQGPFCVLSKIKDHVTCSNCRDLIQWFGIAK